MAESSPAETTVPARVNEVLHVFPLYLEAHRLLSAICAASSRMPLVPGATTGVARHTLGACRSPLQDHCTLTGMLC